MKANEAPQKLYLHPTTKGNVGASWLTFPLTNEDIEYIRKDAFIEKACEWLINHNDYICSSTIGIVKYDMKQLVEDFKKYMEQ